MEADVEMNDAGNLSGADSLVSTAPSEQGSEYEVEEILAERVSKRTGKKKFLLKWANYPLHRATWEPAEMFLEMEDAMLKWNEKTQKVRAGTDQPFDVDAWRKSLKDREREAERRKEARRKKRAERAAQKNDKPPLPSVSNAQPPSRESSPDVPLVQASRLSSPDVPLVRTSANRGSALHKTSQRSASLASDISSLFVSADDPAPKTYFPNGNPPPATPTTAQSLQVPSSSGPAWMELKRSNSSQSVTTVSGNSEKLLPQPSRAAVITSETSQPTHPPQPQISESAKSSRPSQLPNETSETAASTQDKVSDKEPSQGTGQISATGTGRTWEPQSQRLLASTSQTAKQPVLGPLYTAFASNKSRDREPDISQLDLRRPSEFPARTAAGVPLPFAKMTASDKFRRSSQSGTKATSSSSTTASSVSQAAASPGASRRGSFETMGPPGRPRPSSPRSPSLSFRHDSYRPGDSRGSPPPRCPDLRGRSPGSRRRSPGARSRSPDRRPRSPDRRRRSPSSRRRSPEYRRTVDTYRPNKPSPFVTVTRPKSYAPAPTSTTGSSPPATISPPVTGTNTGNDASSVNADALALSAKPPSPPKGPLMSAKDQIQRMPIGQPQPGCMKFQGTPYFVNHTEVLAHVYFGAEKQFIGAVRLCGLTSQVKQDLLAAKGARGRTGKFEMWFKYVCTPDEYATLCHEEGNAGGSNRVVRTCWMEGFADTNPEVFHMSELLYWENKIGIYYPPENHGFVWLAYSQKTADFTHLTQPYPEIDPWVPIRLAVRTPLAPVAALNKAPVGPPMGPQQLQSPAMAVVPYDPSNPSMTGASGSLDGVVGRLAQTSGPSNLNMSIQAQGSYGSPMQNPMERSPEQHPFGQPARESQAVPGQAANLPADPRLRRLSSRATSTRQPSRGQSRPVGDDSGKSNNDHLKDNMGGQYDPMDTGPDNTVPTNTALISVTQNTSVRHPSDSNSMLGEYFERNLKMTLKDLACVNGKRDGPQADVFYLHTPESEEGQNDCTLLKAWLEMNGAMVWSDWAKFVKNSKCGVILFHESFGRYDALRPNIRDVLANPSMGFWTFRISRPLDYPDVRYCQQGVYFQRILTRGGAYLLTEDVLHSLKETLVIVYWFYNIQRSHMGQWKLVCWPNLMECLEEKLEDPNLPKDEQKLLCTLIWVIGKCNSIDSQHPRFQPESLDPTKLDGPNNNILSLAVAGYGERSTNATPGGLTQDERNADHLAEAFAGWTIENAARLRRSYIISSCKNEALLKRWSSWGHVHLFSVEALIEKYKISVKDMLERIQNKLSKSSKPGKPSQPEQSIDRALHDLSSPIQTPLTPGVGSVPNPREPNGDASNRQRSSDWRPPQPQEAHRYAAPYR